MPADVFRVLSMPLALTVFGVAAQGRDPVLCYAFLRDARGIGDYLPKPHLPKAAAPAGTTRLPLALFEGLDVIIWDRLPDDGAATANECCPCGVHGTRSWVPPLTQHQQGTRAYWRGSTVPRAEGISRAKPLASW